MVVFCNGGVRVSHNLLNLSHQVRGFKGHFLNGTDSKGAILVVAHSKPRIQGSIVVRLVFDSVFEVAIVKV